MIVPETNSVRRPADHTNAVGALACMSAAGRGQVDDAQLIRAAQSGNSVAFEQLVQQYDRAILRLTVHLTGSHHDGQDMYQEAFLRAYKSLPRFRFECSFYTWIYRIATNLCLDHLRRRSRRRELSITVSSEDDDQELLDRIPDQSTMANPERSLTGRVLRERIARALSNLSPRERMVFELKHYHGLHMRTVAGILRTTEGTARNTLFRATQKLRVQLSSYDNILVRRP